MTPEHHAWLRLAVVTTAAAAVAGAAVTGLAATVFVVLHGLEDVDLGDGLVFGPDGVSWPSSGPGQEAA